MASVMIDTGPIEAGHSAREVSKDKWSLLVGAWGSFCRVDVPHDCRELVRFVGEATEFEIWSALGYGSLNQFIKEELGLDPDMVSWAVEGLRALRPNEPVPFEKAIAVGRRLRTERGRPTEKELNPNHYHDKVYEKIPYGTSSVYFLARLDRDHPEIAKRVRDGELTPNAAATMLGWRKPESPLQTLRRGWRKASDEERRSFLSEVMT